MTVTTGGGGGGGGGSSGGGGGGGSPAPTVILAALPHVAAQPLAFLYLSQIPYTGLDLGPVGTALYWLALVVWTLAFTYLVLFGVAPFLNRRARNFASRVSAALNALERASAGPVMPMARAGSPFPVARDIPEVPRAYSTYDGFKSFARNGALSVEDIVKSLSRNRPAASGTATKSSSRVEPMYENVGPIETDIAMAEERAVPTHIRGFVSALIEGDRAVVFAALRQQVRDAGAPEELMNAAVCLLDDVYRSRIDGTICDADMARRTARLATPTLEKLVASLATAIDSSYESGVIGAKLALTRALAVLGA